MEGKITVRQHPAIAKQRAPGNELVLVVAQGQAHRHRIGDCRRSPQQQQRSEHRQDRRTPLSGLGRYSQVGQV